MVPSSDAHILQTAPQRSRRPVFAGTSRWSAPIRPLTSISARPSPGLCLWTRHASEPAHTCADWAGFPPIFGFHGTVVPGTLRDLLFILEGLLHQDPRLHPTHIMADSAGYSDIVFGLFALLGYRFSPRLTDLGEV